MSRPPAAPAPAPRSAERPARTAFAAMHNPSYRAYLSTMLLTNMADNMEHVMSYWVMWQAFQSPLLAGFAVIAHWLPSLLFSVHLGQLAQRHDCRRILQVAELLLMSVSLTWAVLIFTGSLQVWQAVILLLGHGLGGAIAGPASQLIIHDMVGPQALQSAIRLNSTGRQLALLFGPGLGGLLLLLIGPAAGLVVNALLYLPLTLWLFTFPYTGHGRDADTASRPPLHWAAALHALRDVRHNRPVLAMIVVGGASSLFIGNVFVALMPGFAADLGADGSGLGYSVLLGANAAGAFVGGLLLEGTGWLRPKVRTAILTTAVWCLCMLGFAAAQSYPLAVVLMFAAGATNLAFFSMAQTLVQLLAPSEDRGRMVGLFSMAALGLRVGSGVTVGVIGSIIGIHWALGLSALALLAVMLVLLAYAGGDATPRERAPAAPA